jgi:hypothetical protein
MKMENLECIKERLILRASLSGQWTDELLAHLASCNACQESMDVSRYMQKLSEVSAAEHPLPNAQYVWWKAQFLDQELAQERATRPLFIAQAVSYAVITLGLVGLLIWKLPQIQQGLAGPITTTQTVALSLSLMALVLLCLTLILGLRACWLED